MIYKPKGRRYYRIKFRWEKKLIQKRTRAASAKVARQIEAEMRSQLAKGNWGVLDPRPIVAPPTLGEFLKGQFLPHVEAVFAPKPNTAIYYQRGAAYLMACDFAKLPLPQITGQHAAFYIAQHQGRHCPGTINCGLRTLRRALNLAEQWGKLDRAPKIALAKGERQRERILTDAEIAAYLPACGQPWRDMATILLGTGLRPGEVYALRWEDVTLEARAPMLRVVAGKSRAARRELPMVPAVFAAVRNRWLEQERPSSGWLFPASTPSGHTEQGSAKNHHLKALKASGVAPFEPYIMRHTALTNLAAAGADAFTLARIAGHSSITITQRYCHPQADAIARAFGQFGANRLEVVPNGGSHSENAAPEAALRASA